LPDYLQRDQAPLGVDQWAAFDQTATRTAQSMLVARRFINLVGPFGPGIEALPNDTISGATAGHIDLLGTQAGDAIGIDRRRFLPLPLLYKDFWIHWRDLESSRQLGVPLEVGKVAAAAAATAQAEDRLVFDGEPSLGLPGLRNAEGRQTLPMSDWGSMGRAFADVVEGMRALIQAGFTGPYALAVSPRLYADLNRIFDDTGVLELEQVEKLARRVIGWDAPRGLQPSTYPLEAPRGPVVALADEYAGSDGDIVTAAIKIMRLGPVVGARTWGGVIGIDVPFHELADGTQISVPRYATWLDGYGWGVENHGVDPDVEVIPSPEDLAAGMDRQLETAVRLAMEALDARPAVTAPDTSGRPSRRPAALPPRQATGG